MRDAKRSWTVVVVDDSPEFLDAVCAWMKTQPRLDVVATAADGAEAVDRVATHRPDLVVMDALMPGVDGFEATRRLKESGNAGRVVIVSFHDSETVRQEAWAAGADGFIAKSDLIGTLPDMLHGFECEAADRHDGPSGQVPSSDADTRPRPAARNRRPTPPDAPVDRRRAIGRAIGAFVRGLVPLDLIREPAGLVPVVETSGIRGGSHRGPSTSWKREE